MRKDFSDKRMDKGVSLEMRVSLAACIFILAI
jgi:hypothetical protein